MNNKQKELVLHIAKKALTAEEYVYPLIKEIGFFDSGSRFYLHDAFQTDTSYRVRTPSRAWPYSVYKHVMTKKYLKSLIAKLEQEQQLTQGA